MTTIRWTINAVCSPEVDSSDCSCGLPGWQGGIGSDRNSGTLVSNTIITSPHGGGGTNFGVMDGSVHYISQNADLNNVLLRLAARNDGQTVNLP